MMESLFLDLRFGYRMLAKTPGFTAIAVLTLALGIAANTAIFSVVYDVLLRSLPYPKPERLVMLWESNPRVGTEQEDVSPANFVDWKDQSDVFEGMAFWPSWSGGQDFTLVGPEGPEHARGVYASASLFEVMGVKPILGRTFYTEEDQREGNRVAILSYDLWQRRFGGDHDILNRTLTIDTFNKRDYTIVGVMPQGFQFPETSEFWLAAGWMGLDMHRRAAHWLNVVARLKPNISSLRAKQQMDSIASRLSEKYPEARIGSEVKVVPLLDQVVGNVRPILVVLSCAVALVLLIACANVANMLLARANTRRAEMAIRATLGASPSRIIRQLLAECLLLAVPGAGLGLLSAWWGTRLLVAAASRQIPRLSDISISPPVLLFTMSVTVLAIFLFSLFPALYVSKPDLVDSLKSGVRTSTSGVGGSRVRSFLVISEVALAILLLIGAGLMIRSLIRLEKVDPGFQPERVLSAEIDMSSSSYSSSVRPGPNRPQVFFQRLTEQIGKLNGVESSCGTINLPLSPAAEQSFSIEGHGLSVTDLPMAATRAVTPQYFETLRTHMIEGRDFTDRDTETSPPVAIINETLARRFFPGEDPIGKRLDFGVKERFDRDGRFQPTWHEIIGIVGDAKNSGLQNEPRPEVYKPYFQWSWHKAYLLVRTQGNPLQVEAAVREVVKSLNPDQPVSRVNPLEQLVGEAYALARLRARLLGGFGLTALMLSAVGIYGVISYSVTQRTQEVGLRIALGAQTKDVFRLVLSQGMRLTLIGLGVGLVTAVGVTRLMRSLLYGIESSDPWTFACAAILIFVTALIACWTPARRASRFDPIEALRHE